MPKKSTRKSSASTKTVETLTHDEAKRSNIPTAELETVMEDNEAYSIQVAIERRNPDLDPQLVWRGKDTKNWSDLVVNTPPLFIQEKTQAVAAIQTLAASDFPLSRTTSHQTQVTIHGVDVFHPQTGEVRSDGADGIACWFIDTNYNEEKLLRPPRLLPTRRRPLQKPQNNPQSRDQRRSLGHPPQRHQPPLRQTQNW